MLLYELLTGSTPFDRQRLSQAGFDELRRIIREEEPVQPSHRLDGALLHTFRGKALEHLGRNEQALVEFDAADELVGTTWGIPRYRLAAFVSRLSDAELKAAAVERVRKQAEMHPWKASTWERLFVVAQRAEDWETGVTAFNRLIQLVTKDDYAALVRVVTDFPSGDPRHAAAIAEKLAALNPRNPDG